MPIPLLIAVIIAAMVGVLAFGFVHGSYRMRLLLFLVIALGVLVFEMLVFGVSG